MTIKHCQDCKHCVRKNKYYHSCTIKNNGEWDDNKQIDPLSCSCTNFVEKEH